MSEVERHVIDSVGQMEPDANGYWVSYDDYRKLEAEMDEWKKKYEVLLDEHKMVRRGIDDVIDNCLESEFE